MVAAVHEQGGLVDVWTDDGGVVRLAGEQVDRVDYGYATTVHRAQGATVDRARVYADGGGRKLAYVAMSRARDATRVYAVADDIEVALDELRREWMREERQRHVIQTGLPVTAEASQHENDLSQPQLANILAIARHEKAGGDETARAAIQADLDR